MLAGAPPSAPRLTARHAYIGNLNDTLLAVNANAPVPIASLSKLITAWVVFSAKLKLFSFDFGDSSGLSAFNKASARDPGVLLVMLAQSPWFRNLARKPAVGGKMNVNRFSHDREARAQDMNVLRQFTRQSLAAAPGEMIRR